MVRLDRDVVEATGAESGIFLQGQLSQDVLAVPVGATTWSWVLGPAGKVDALVRVHRRAESSWLLDTDAGWGEALAARLNRFKLRTKADIALTPYGVIGVRADGEPVVGTESIAICDPWPGVSGQDLIVDRAAYESVTALSAQAYEAERIASGQPRMGAELDEKTIPGETGLIDLTVSFTKGCYTGQELVARIDSRGGNVARRLARMTMSETVAPGTDLYQVDQVAGLVTSSAAVPGGGYVGLGYVKRAYPPPVTLTAGAGGPAVLVEPLGR
jgi:folate-binding protein YgfZ